MFHDLPLWINIAVFIASAVVVWFAGTRVSRYADRIQRQYGLGEAVVGMLLLGLITALPELAVTVTASHAGNANLAINNLLGGMALNVAILAAADVVIKGEALTHAVASVMPLLQGVLLLVMLAIVAAATVVGDSGVFAIGIWSWLLLGGYCACAILVHRSRGQEPWTPQDKQADAAVGEAQRQDADDGTPDEPPGRLAGKTVLGALAILGAGYAIAQTGDSLGEQTGLGQNFFGAIFVSLSTSLPEMTIVFASVRLANYSMAVANIFGANLFGLALLFVADAVYREGPILNEAGPFATFAALLCIAVSALFVAGLLERRHAMVRRMGVDSLIVIGTYLAGVAVLYTLK